MEYNTNGTNYVKPTNRIANFKTFSPEVEIDKLKTAKRKMDKSVDGSNLATKFTKVYNPVTNKIEDVTEDDINDTIVGLEKGLEDKKNEAMFYVHFSKEDIPTVDRVLELLKANGYYEDPVYDLIERHISIVRN